MWIVYSDESSDLAEFRLPKLRIVYLNKFDVILVNI